MRLAELAMLLFALVLLPCGDALRLPAAVGRRQALLSGAALLGGAQLARDLALLGLERGDLVDVRELDHFELARLEAHLPDGRTDGHSQHSDVRRSEIC